MHSRLAPTPSGRLHIGNIFNFILTYWFVRSQGGKLTLRIDDSDKSRSRDEYVQDIFDTLNWLSLDYDEGPKDLTDLKNHFSQQKKYESYYDFFNDDDDLFACGCSRKSYEHLGHYPGTCKDLNIKFERGVHALRLIDNKKYPVLWRKDDMPAYHLCSLKDDLDLGVTHIIRGSDLKEASELQKEIAKLLGKKFDANIYHHGLITKNGQKLSKTQKDRGVREFFRGPQEVFDYLAPYLKTERFSSVKELAKRDFNQSGLLQH